MLISGINPRIVCYKKKKNNNKKDSTDEKTKLIGMINMDTTRITKRPDYEWDWAEDLIYYKLDENEVLDILRTI